MAPPPPPTPPISNESGRIGRDIFFLLLLCLLLFGLRLGSAPLANPDEGRYAEIPREMLASGDWVTPRLDGVNYFEKPPLVYWMTAASLKYFGQNEWAVRAVPAFFALAGILLTYGAARRLYGRTAGLAAGIVLATALLYFALARIVLLDMAVSVLMSGALFAFILGVREPAGARRRWLFYGLYACMALATLTKGLIGFLVTGAVMFFWLLIFNQWRRLRPLYLPTGALLFLAIAVPWHVLAAQHNATWVHRYFVYEHWERFTSPAASRPGPWWYFIPVLVAGLFPWTGFLPSALREGLRGGWSARKRNAEAWFFVLWAVLIFGFFSASHSKLVTYILPIFPPLAVLIGVRLASAWQGRKRELDGGLVVFTVFCVILAAGLALAVLRPPASFHLLPEQARALRPYAFALVAIALAGGALAHHLAQMRGVRAALSAVAVTAVLFYGTLTLVVADIQRPGTKELALIVKAGAHPGDRVVHYHEFFHDFTFYAERVVDVVSGKGELELEEDAAARAGDRFMDDAEFRQRWEGPVRLWVVARKTAVTELFADPTFRYHLLGESRNHYLFSNQP